jgi:hypothetical protein
MLQLGLTFSTEHDLRELTLGKETFQLIPFDWSKLIDDVLAKVEEDERRIAVIQERHDDTWWLAGSRALKALESVEMGSLSDENTPFDTIPMTPLILDIIFEEEMSRRCGFSFVHDGRVYDDQFNRLSHEVKNEDFPVTSFTFRLKEENITFVSLSDFIHFIMKGHIARKYEYQPRQHLQPSDVVLFRKRALPMVHFDFTYHDAEEGSKTVTIYESTIHRAAKDMEMNPGLAIRRTLESLMHKMDRMPVKRKEEHQPYH